MIDKFTVFFPMLLWRKHKIQFVDIYPQEDLKIGMVYEKMGFHEKAAAFFKSYANYCEKDEPIFKPGSMATLYAHEGKINEAIKQLKVFATKSNIQYWVLLFMKTDRVYKSLKTHPEFNKIMKKMEDQFWDNQAKLKKTLEAEGLL
jgi:hypothetical protein